MFPFNSIFNTPSLLLGRKTKETFPIVLIFPRSKLMLLTSPLNNQELTCKEFDKGIFILLTSEYKDIGLRFMLNLEFCKGFTKPGLSLNNKFPIPSKPSTSLKSQSPMQSLKSKSHSLLQFVFDLHLSTHWSASSLQFLLQSIPTISSSSNILFLSSGGINKR